VVEIAIVVVLALVALVAVPMARAVWTGALAITDAQFSAVMLLAGTCITALGAVLVAWFQGRKTRASHQADHGDTRAFVTDQVIGLRDHIDGRFDHVDARLDSHDTRITRVENRP
jgi:hypothetical protein